MIGRLIVLALALTLAGCGGDDDSDSSASENYANSVCGQMSMWVADQRDTVASLQDAGLSLTREDLAAAVGDVRDSTQVLVEDLRDDDPPIPTPATKRRASSTTSARR